MSERSLFELADDLCKKIREIEQHPNYKSIWQLAHVHGVIYRGPTYTEEIEALERFLHGEVEKVPRVKRNDGKYAEYDPEQSTRVDAQPSPTPTRAEWEMFARNLANAIYFRADEPTLTKRILSMPIVPKKE